MASGRASEHRTRWLPRRWNGLTACLCMPGLGNTCPLLSRCSGCSLSSLARCRASSGGFHRDDPRLAGMASRLPALGAALRRPCPRLRQPTADRRMGQVRPDANGHCPRKRQVPLNGGCWLPLELDSEGCGALNSSGYNGQLFPRPPLPSREVFVLSPFIFRKELLDQHRPAQSTPVLIGACLMPRLRLARGVR
jgi:hypothetical protein